MQPISALKPQINACYHQDCYEQSLPKFATLRADVDNFFEQVMVNADDASLKQNYLLILQMMDTILSTTAIFLLLDLSNHYPFFRACISLFLFSR